MIVHLSFFDGDENFFPKNVLFRERKWAHFNVQLIYGGPFWAIICPFFLESSNIARRPLL